MTHIPFAPAFSRKTDKPYHGRHSSFSQSEPTLLPSWNVRNRSILFVDDCITTGTIPLSAGLPSPGQHGQPRGWLDLGERGRIMFGISLHFDHGKGILKETIRGSLIWATMFNNKLN